MKIYVVGSSKNKFLPLDNIREKFLVDVAHQGANIDFLNPWYCELTGLFYLFAHETDHIVGLEHYRNYFWSNGRPITETEINKKLTEGDIICGGFAYPAWGCSTLRPELAHQVKGSLPTFLQVLHKRDAGLADYFEQYLDGTRLWCCNTFIGPKAIIDQWVVFLFRTLGAFERISKIGPNTDTLRREGYFAEFLFGAWLEYNKYSIVHCNMRKLARDLSRTEFMVTGPTQQLKF